MFLAVSASNASIVFVTLTSDAIYIGADGRLTLTDAAGKETYGETCKIRDIGRFLVADTGTISGPIGPSDTFDVWSELESIKASSVTDFAEKLSTTLPAKFQSVFTERSRRTGKPFQEFIPGDIAIAGFEGGVPAFVRVIFLTVNGKITANRKNDGADFARNVGHNSGARSTVPLGEFSLLPLGTDPNCFANFDIAENMRCNINAYIKADPTHINEPIAIRKLTKDGADWIGEHKACKDDQ